VYLGELSGGTQVAVKDIAVRSSDIALEVSYSVSLKVPSHSAVPELCIEYDAAKRWSTLSNHKRRSLLQ
jgi:hypothetical protein